MYLVVCGSRDYTDKATLWRVMDDVLADWRKHWHEDPVVLHGQCPYGGADALAEEWAKARSLDVQPHPPKGKGRGPMLQRDREMVDAPAELVCAFSSKEPATPGTGYTCRYAYENGVPVVFTGPDGEPRRFFNERWTTAAV